MIEQKLVQAAFREYLVTFVELVGFVSSSFIAESTGNVFSISRDCI